MWKARPVIATEIGGIRNQIEHGVTGLMLRDPLDLEALGAAMSSLLADPERAWRLGIAARESVRRSFLPNRPALQYVDLIERLSSG
jgi:trehalose synthase